MPSEAQRRAQEIARRTLEEIRAFLRPGVSESGIADECRRLMQAEGADGFWYHGVAALVQVGERTATSVSGRDYRPSDTKVRDVDLVTIDVSPRFEGGWGDCARSFLVHSGAGSEAGRVPMELRRGLQAQDLLHRRLREHAEPGLRFGELHDLMQEELIGIGFELLDFRGCFGHTIERGLDERRFIAKGVDLELGEAPSFAFEPHVRQQDGRYGFKHENVYFFEDDRLQML